MTWACEVCGDERPEELIAVVLRDVSEAMVLPPGTVGRNVRHCTDRRLAGELAAAWARGDYL